MTQNLKETRTRTKTRTQTIAQITKQGQNTTLRQITKKKNWTIDTRCLQLSQDPNLLLFNHTTKCIQQDTNELN